MTTMTETMNTRVRMRRRCAVDEGTETPEEFEVDDRISWVALKVTMPMNEETEEEMAAPETLSLSPNWARSRCSASA